MTIEIVDSVITRIDGESVCRRATIVIGSGDTSYLLNVGGLPLDGDLLTVLGSREVELWVIARSLDIPVRAEDTARLDFRKLPNWATWSATEAANYVQQQVLGGMDKAALDTWIDTNVTTLPTARTALKLLGGDLIDLREICQNLARAVMYLRDVSIK